MTGMSRMSSRFSVHYPECNVWCNARGHWLLSSGPQGNPFSHQGDGRETVQLSGIRSREVTPEYEDGDD